MSYMVLIANAKDGTISTFDYRDGSLTPLATSPVGAPGLPLAWDPTRGLLFAGVKDPAGIEVLRLEETGEIAPVGRVKAMGGASYLALSPDADLLFSASYHEGVGEAWTITEDGSLTPFGKPLHHLAMHCVVPSDDAEHVYFVSLREDAIIECAITEHDIVPHEPCSRAPEGSGPRHLILSDDGTTAYVITEYSGQVLRYARDEDGSLTFLDAHSVVPQIDGEQPLGHSHFDADPRSEGLIWCADIHLSNDGTILFTSERTRSRITATRLEDGSLSDEQVTSSVVSQPRAFAILPDDRLLVASETDEIAALYEVTEDGHLSMIQQVEVGRGANWIEIIETTE